MTNGNAPAYPSDHEYTEGGYDGLDAPVIVHKTSFGLTKREYFAAMAMQGMISNPYFAENAPRTEISEGVESLDQHLVRRAVQVADALTTELNKTT